MGVPSCSRRKRLIDGSVPAFSEGSPALKTPSTMSLGPSRDETDDDVSQNKAIMYLLFDYQDTVADPWNEPDGRCCCVGCRKRLFRLADCFQRDHDVEEDFPPLRTITPGVTSVTQRRRSRSRGGRSRSRGRSASVARSRSRTPAVRIGTQGVHQGTWATKVKKTAQPQVKEGAASEHVSFELVDRIQKENATLESIIEQLRAEIAEMKEAKAVKAALPSRPNRPVETLGESPAVPMDTHSEVRPAKRKAPSEQIRKAELDFQTQIADSIAEIKKTQAHGRGDCLF
ncbi:hypothetical protein HPB50_022134 [Hyalomma asiaticum]|uniref:Uncharacterized protein n=1 Tax=Hyalomma asiaticum TaxID=266040 RepID=A0ACB7TP04_HYAAI|nr:hypothetical protein HPB50_022134 [Hyalomma asiaticum]